MPLADGQTFAGYKILRLLGSGGMGEVYLAQHPRLPRTDALKVLGADVSANAEYRARFAREADLASTLWHPHIVGVHDRGDDEQLWISMDYVDGVDAAHLLAEKFPDGMPARQVVKIVTAVANALDYAHDRGLLHRDIKPANIMITTDEQRILLTDFGIARSVTEVSSLTATGFTIGTVAYSAPEQLTGGELDGRADQYALAATAYHLLSGAQLFPHSNPAVVIGRHLNTAPTPLANTRPELAALDPVLATALAKNPDDRFRRCTDFANALALAPSKLAADRAGGRAAKTTPQADHTEPAARSPKTIDAEPTAANPPRMSPADPTRAAIPVAVSQHSQLLKRPKVSKEALWRHFGRRRRRPIAVGLALLVVVALAIAVQPWHWIAPSAPSHSPAAATAGAQISFDTMRAFVEDYYSDLPDDPTNAWKKVDAQWQNKTGWQDFVDFWATIQVVKLVSVSPRDATSVVARVRYFPRNGEPSTEDRWLRLKSADGQILLDESGRIGPVNDPMSPAPAPVGVVSAAALNTLLPVPTEVSRVAQAPPLKVKSATDQLSDNSSLVTPSTCVGVIFGGERAVFANSGFTGIRDQILTADNYSYDSSAPTLVEQTVVLFPTSGQAQANLASTQRQWEDCARGLVSYTVPNTNNEVGWSFNFGGVQLSDNLLTVSMAGINRESGNSACQQTLGVRSNVVVGVRSCNNAPGIPVSASVADPDLAGRSAERLARNILSRIQS